MYFSRTAQPFLNENNILSIDIIMASILQALYLLDPVIYKNLLYYMCAVPTSHPSVWYIVRKQ